MLLVSLELESIRSYREAKITFPKGRTLLSGDIGAGKSTILLAIEFALFGIVRGWNDGDKLLRHGAPRGRVRLEADIGGEIIIERSLKRSSNGIQQEDVLISEDGIERRITPSEARALIVSRLGYPEEFATKQPTLFRYTIFTPQESMKAIIDERTDVRLDAIRKIFGIDRYERISSNAQIVARALKGRIATLSGRLERKPVVIEEISAIKRELEELSSQIERADDDQRTKNAALKAANERLESAREALEAERAKRDTISRLKAERAEFERELESLIAERSSLPEPVSLAAPDIESIESSIAKLENELRELDESIAQVRDEISTRGKLDIELKGRIERVVELIERLERSERERREGLERIAQDAARFERFDADAVRETMTGYDASLQELIEERAKITERIKATGERIEMMPAEGICPVCEQTIDESHREHAIGLLESTRDREIVSLKRVRESIAEIEEKRATLRSRLETYDTIQHAKERLPADESESLAKNLDLREKMMKNRSELENRLASLNERLESLAIERTALIERRTTRTGELKRAHTTLLRIEESKRSAERRLAIDARTKLIREKLAAITIPALDASIEHAFEEAKRIAERTLEEARTASLARERLGERQHSANDRKERAMNELVSLRELENERSRYDTIVGTLTNEVPDLARQIENGIMARIRIEMNDRFSKWFSMLVLDLEGYLDESFSPMIIQNGYDVSFSDLSGGERTSVALAFRLALHESINHLTGQSSTGLLVLDEPTEGFSSEQLSSVREVLTQINSEQVIIVSHEEQVEGFVDQTIRIDKSGYESAIR